VALRPALPGSGAFLLRLHERGVPLIPVGISEPEGLLTARFGAPIELRVARSLPPAERDAAAGQRIMAAIGRLLPSDLWGAYRETLEAETLNQRS
jgi:hypothetical protein